MKTITKSTKAELVSMAITPKVVPKDIAPVSPMKNRAGYMLNHKKARIAPATAAEKEARSILFWKKEMMEKAVKANSSTPPFRPSRPSVSLEDMAEKRITKIKT